MENLKKLLETHPFDWICHFILGFIVVAINFGIFQLVFPASASLALLVAAAANFCIAVELTQFDIFGILPSGSQCTRLDYFMDILADGAGIFVALKVFGVL